MNQKHIHVISFNVPFPADYGGVIDVFYRLKALQEAGMKIHLHCFEYGRSKQSELERVCESVHYYHRSKALFHHFSMTPFIVKTRSNKALLNGLLNDDYPIFFEGLHSCYFLNDRRLKKRRKIVRCHNVEHDYYRNLSYKATTIKERLFFKLEAAKLKRFEKVLCAANKIAAISDADKAYFETKYSNVFLLPPSHSNNKVQISSGRGEYILYHGNLSVQENEEAVLFLLEKVAPNIPYMLIVAGKNPTRDIRSKVKLLNKVELISNPSADELDVLLKNAHINLLPTFQATGFKLKLLNALFNGRFCVGTPELVEGTNLENLCVVSKSEQEMIADIIRVFKCDFTTEDIEERERLLKNHTNNYTVSNSISVLMSVG